MKNNDIETSYQAVDADTILNMIKEVKDNYTSLRAEQIKDLDKESIIKEMTESEYLLLDIIEVISGTIVEGEELDLSTVPEKYIKLLKESDKYNLFDLLTSHKEIELSKTLRLVK